MRRCYAVVGSIVPRTMPSLGAMYTKWILPSVTWRRIHRIEKPGCCRTPHHVAEFPSRSAAVSFPAPGMSLSIAYVGMFMRPRLTGKSNDDSMRLTGHYIPRDHFCIHMQAPAAATQQSPTNGILDMNAQTAALIRHRNIAKAPMRMLAMDWVFWGSGFSRQRVQGDPW